jgi:hypothetical protein
MLDELSPLYLSLFKPTDYHLCTQEQSWKSVITMNNVYFSADALHAETQKLILENVTIPEPANINLFSQGEEEYNKYEVVCHEEGRDPLPYPFWLSLRKCSGKYDDIEEFEDIEDDDTLPMSASVFGPSAARATDER